MDLLKLGAGALQLLRDLSLLLIHLGSSLLQIRRLPCQVVRVPVQLMSQASDRFIFLKILSHKLFNSPVQLDSLRLKVLNLPLEGRVFRALSALESLFNLVKLAFKVLVGLLLDGQFVFDLCIVTLLVLLQVRKLVLQVFKLDIFFSRRLSDFSVKLVGECLDASTCSIFLLHYARFQLSFLHLLHIFHLR